MKHVVSKSYLLGFSLLLAFLIIWIVGVTSWQIINTINTNMQIEDQHKWRFYLLNLGSGDNYSALKIGENDSFLTVNSWLIVWSWVNANGSLIMIWWWENNNISDWYNWWIAWWKNNTLEWGNSVIWWWQWNKVVWDNAVVAAWSGNFAWEKWVVVWWFNNSWSNGVILWWISNEADWDYSLVMWSGAKWKIGSFSWNAEAWEDSARIDAKSGVLIWTYTPITWVSLVVSWAVKLDGTNSTLTWWIYFTGGRTFDVYDGVAWHTLGKNSESSSNNNPCRFWNVLLQQWDTATWYVNYFTGGLCEWVSLTCGNWNMKDSSNRSGYYPYCYEIFKNN